MTKEEKKFKAIWKQIKKTPKSVYNTLCTLYEKIIKPFLDFLWFFVRIIAVIALYLGYLYILSELVIRGIAESSPLPLAVGVGGYIMVGIVTLLLIHDHLYDNDKYRISQIHNQIRCLANEIRFISSADRVSNQITSVKDDIRLMEIKSKLFEMEMEIKEEIGKLRK